MIKRILKRAQSGFIRNVLIMASGTAGAQAIALAFAPLITRIYGPEAFGVLGIFTAVLAVMSPIAALTFPVAIVLPKSDVEAIGIAKLSVVTAFFIAVLSTVVLLSFGEFIAEQLNLKAIERFLLLIPIAMFFTAIHQIMQQWLIRKMQFNVSARIAVSQSLILNGAKVGLGLPYPSGAILVLLATLGNGLYAVQLWFGAKRWSAREEHIDYPVHTKISMRKLAIDHRGFPLFRAPQVLINALTSSMPVLILAAFYDTAIAGYFTLTNSVLAAPAMLIGKSVGSVFYPKIVGVIHDGKAGLPILLKVMALLFSISLLPFLSVALFGVEIFQFVFGEEWKTSGIFAGVLALSVFLGIVHRPCESVMYAYGFTKQYFIVEVFFTILMVFAMSILGANDYSYMVVVAIYMSLKSAYYLFIIFFCIYKVKNNLGKM